MNSAHNNLKIDIASDSSIVILPFSVKLGDGEIDFFLNVQKVAQVVEFGGMSKLPETMKPFCAVHDHGGLPVPVIDLGAWLSPDEELRSRSCVNSAPDQPDRRIIISNSLGQYVGLIVSRTRKVRRQKNDEIYAAPDFFDRDVPSYISGIIKEESGYLYMFDIEGFLESHGVTVSKVSTDRPTDRFLEGKRILIVEDSHLFQQLGQKVLTAHGAQVEIANNGKEALIKLIDQKEQYDLILADIEMPIMNGIEMARTYKKTVHQGAPILFHSSLSNPTLINEIERDGLGNYLIKFEEHHVLGKLKELLAA